MKEDGFNPGRCDIATDHLIDLMVSGELNEDVFNELCEEHSQCRDILSDLYTTWNGLDNINVPRPGQEMHTRFYKSLSEWKPDNEEQIGKVISLKPLILGGKKFIMKYGIAASLFLGGLATGMIIFSQLGNSGPEVSYVAVPEEDKNVKMVSTSVDRLSTIQELKHKDINRKIIDALYQALIKDPNTNVRLSAIEAMVRYADNPDVRRILIQAIPYQTTPIVQLTLAEVMMELNEEASSEAWQQLLKSEEMELDVRLQLKEMLHGII